MLQVNALQIRDAKIVDLLTSELCRDEKAQKLESKAKNIRVIAKLITLL